MLSTAEQIDAAVKATGAPIDGVSPIPAGAVINPALHLVTRGDGQRFYVSYQANATAAQITAGDNAAKAADLTASGLTTAQLVQERNAAKVLIASDPSPTGKALRAILLATLDEINAVRAKLVPPLAAIPQATFRASIAAKLNTNAAD